MSATAEIEDEVELVSAAAPVRQTFSRELVQEVLFELWKEFEPQLSFGREFARCSRLAAVGGFRRRKVAMKDLELLYISRIEMRADPGALFDSMQVETDVTEQLLNELLARGVLGKRLNKNGALSAWGAWNKHAVHVASGLPIDLFRATDENWHNRMVVTTGPLELNVRIAERARRMHPAYEWEVGEAGFVPLGMTWATAPGSRVVMASEEDVFRFVKLPFVAPEERR